MSDQKLLNLSSGISQLKGVGPEVQIKLNRLGIFTVQDLINHLPFRYDDFSNINTINNIQSGQQTVKAKIKTVAARYGRVRSTHITEAIISDGTASLKCVWFNQPWRARSLQSSKEYFFSGDFGMHYNAPVMLNPSVELVSDFPANTARILPIYKQTKGLNSKTIRKLQAQVRHLIAETEDDLNPEIIKLNNLKSAEAALENLHWPSSSGDIEQAKNRFKFEEVFSLMMASKLNKQESQQLQAPALKLKLAKIKKMISSLPFELTDDQKKAAWAVMQDLQKSQPMNRLVQGDVGSGKTVVALLAALQALEAGYQCAVIAPTEILADQHFKFFDQQLAKHGFRPLSLTSSTNKADRHKLQQALDSNQPICVVGTHAVLQKSLKFSKLGLIIIDEQHRFGVKQRQALQARQNLIKVPHLLSLSATPIPRSMMLTVYGELDVSIIKQMPAGRIPVETNVVLPSGREHLYQQVTDKLEAGGQAFIICPRIESDSETELEDQSELELKSVQTELKKISSHKLLKQFKIAMVHGKMKPAEKNEIMIKFRDGQLDILISTTVVEVGVDIPGANMIIIEGAERFGLAQLHQLRGRVGRNNQQAWAWVVPTTDSAIPTRLRYFERVASGFDLAKYDLKLRGPGQMFGLSQSGKFQLRFADLADIETINKVKKSLQFINDNNLGLNKNLLNRINQIRKVSILN